MLFHRENRKLLGVHAIGTGATELIHIGQAVLGLGGGLDYFLQTVFNYPTLAECYKGRRAGRLQQAPRLNAISLSLESFRSHVAAGSLYWDLTGIRDTPIPPGH
jgi:hypothetical protein